MPSSGPSPNGYAAPCGSRTRPTAWAATNSPCSLEDSQENNPQRLAERLLAALVQPIALNGERIDFVTPSIGIALYPRHAGDAEGLVRAADSAMYEAKRQRNHYCLYQAPA